MSSMTVRTHHRARGLGVLGAVAALSVYMVISAVPAWAVVTCAISGAPPSQTLTVTMAADADTVSLAVAAGNITVTGTGADASCTGPFAKADVSTVLVNAGTPAEVEAQTVNIDGSGDFTASIAVDLGAGNDTVNVQDATGADPISADLGEGSDVFGTTMVDGALSVIGAAGNDDISTGGGN
ncbi:MAG TPA: hypothetical protein VIX62_05500, partial [Actinomycetota bacterium]